MEIANPFAAALRGFALFWLTGLLGLAFAVGTAQPAQADNAPRPSAAVPAKAAPAPPR